MDGNASDANEEFLITSIKRDVPESLKQISKLFAEIDATA